MPDEEQESPEEIRKRQKEEEQKENEEDEEEFHLHMGKILGIKGFHQISSISWDKSYDSPTGTSKVEIHYSKDRIKDIIRYVYKGVSCKVKIRRSTDKEFKTTYIEEIGLDEEGIKSREHYPTKEQKEEVEAEISLDELVNEKTDEEKEKEAEETIPKTRSDSDAGIYGFVTDVTHTQRGTELEIKDWGFALEDKTKRLSFSGRLRSQILEEVIKTYGLVPIVDFTGLHDDIIDWTNVTANEEEGGDSDGGKILGDDAIEIGNALASKYGFCAGAGSEDYATMQKKGCGSCWAWSDALYTELTKIGYKCRIVEYATSYVGNHRSVEINENGEWVDYPYRDTNIPKLAHSTSNHVNGKVIRG